MKRINKPTKPGLYGYAMPEFSYIEYARVFRSDSELKCRLYWQLKRKIGILIKDFEIGSEWYKPSLWDRFKFLVVKVSQFYPTLVRKSIEQ